MGQKFAKKHEIINNFKACYTLLDAYYELTKKDETNYSYQNLVSAIQKAKN